jgi:hypothetical protein
MDFDQKRMDIVSLTAGRETDAAVHRALGYTGEPPAYSTDIYIAIRVAAEKGWALIPVEVYKNEHEWNSTLSEHKSMATWWAVVNVVGNVSLYMPISSWIKEWEDYLTCIDEVISPRHLATTIPLVVSKCILLAEKGWGP